MILIIILIVFLHLGAVCEILSKKKMTNDQPD